MDWAEDLKMTIKKTVKKGRRAEQSQSSTTNLSSDSPSTPEFENNVNDGFLDDFSSGLDLKTVPMKLKKVGGWADEASRSGSSGKNRLKANQNEMERFHSISTATVLSDDEIPVIPDLDDIPDEMNLNENHGAQAIAVNRVATYKELNHELLKYSAFASSENIDLSKLMNCLQNENVLVDKDVPLTSEQLFQEVATYIHSCQMKNDDASPRFIN